MLMVLTTKLAKSCTNVSLKWTMEARNWNKGSLLWSRNRLSTTRIPIPTRIQPQGWLDKRTTTRSKRSYCPKCSNQYDMMQCSQRSTSHAKGGNQTIRHTKTWRSNLHAKNHLCNLMGSQEWKREWQTRNPWRIQITCHCVFWRSSKTVPTITRRKHGN
jgi:hypothetical protein